MKRLLRFLIESGPTCGLLLLVVGLAVFAVLAGYQAIQHYAGASEDCSQDFVVNTDIPQALAWKSISEANPGPPEPDAAGVFLRDGKVHVTIGLSERYIEAEVTKLCLDENLKLYAVMGEWKQFDRFTIFPLDHMEQK